MIKFRLLTLDIVELGLNVIMSHHGVEEIPVQVILQGCELP